MDRVDLFRRLLRDFLDVDAALGRNDEGDAARGAVDQQRQVIFLGDVDAVGDVEAVDLLAGLARLDRHQGLAQHLVRMRANLFQVAHGEQGVVGKGPGALWP